jgi:hypothetical protein
MNNSNFSTSGYEELIDAFLVAGYRFSKFEEKLVPGERPLVLFRHDIDLDVLAAYELAKLEKKLEIQSTYCFAITSPYYNIFSHTERALVMEIFALGHDIALHYDSSLHGDASNGLFRELEIFTSFFPFANTKIFSLHRPVSISENSAVDHLVNMSSKILWDTPFFYISDSTGQWLFGHPLQSSGFLDRQNMQVLTHPIWWIRKGTNQLEKIKDSFIQNTNIKNNFLRLYLPKLFNLLGESDDKDFR